LLTLRIIVRLLDALMALAKQDGGTVVSMKDDWRTIFPPENKCTNFNRHLRLSASASQGKKLGERRSEATLSVYAI
jgi:hypothetical protein